MYEERTGLTTINGTFSWSVVTQMIRKEATVEFKTNNYLL
jgi:hypothetical protein